MEQNIEVNGNKIFLKISPYSARLSIATYKRKAIDALAKIGIEQRYIDIQFGGGSGFRENSWAEMSWIVNGQEHKYRCDSQTKDVDNVAAIAQVIAQDSKAVRRGLKSFGQVMNQFRLDAPGTTPHQKTAREIIGVESYVNDMAYITFQYKQRAKELHPDSQNGDKEAMQKLNEALAELHKELNGDL
ncbi:hypothetical protein GQ473_02560 [archaeon]|nr:hypothetical protein [archaeon]